LRRNHHHKPYKYHPQLIRTNLQHVYDFAMAALRALILFTAVAAVYSAHLAAIDEAVLNFAL
jgi:hypothetical protein